MLSKGRTNIWRVTATMKTATTAKQRRSKRQQPQNWCWSSSVETKNDWSKNVGTKKWDWNVKEEETFVAILSKEKETSKQSEEKGCANDGKEGENGHMLGTWVT